MSEPWIGIGLVVATFAALLALFSIIGPLLQPEVLVGRAHEKFDADGRLKDESTRRFLADFLERFEAWVREQQTGMASRSA